MLCTYTKCSKNGVKAVIGSMEEVKKNKKVLYHFAIFAIVNELLIIKNRISPNASARRDVAAQLSWLLGAVSCLLQAVIATH